MSAGSASTRQASVSSATQTPSSLRHIDARPPFAAVHPALLMQAGARCAAPAGGASPRRAPIHVETAMASTIAIAIGATIHLGARAEGAGGLSAVTLGRVERREAAAGGGALGMRSV